MGTLDILKILVEKIHTVVVATVDQENKPITCAIDLMDFDNEGIYFLTAKGKNFYKRLIDKKCISLTGIKGKDTMSSLAISVNGYVKEIGEERLPTLLEKNPYMYQIYPSESSRKALSVFHLYKGNGELFDLSKKPIEKYPFSFGDEKLKEDGYFITDACVGCNKCIHVCPQSCIEVINKKARIINLHCLRCGNCYYVCPTNCIVRK